MTEKKKDERTSAKKPNSKEMPADPKELAKVMFWENDRKLRNSARKQGQ